ncbi:hypothetical protein EJM73_08435 [Clostridium botulinum]|uniref:hypothetical protein n=1 Tax=Clostridium botulinum TaxID=1491 RepID=UPI0013764600|nr:hypothetical protein [Clostridium botulinum]NCI19926.1 hypothetical protein [Clostridium botulinum]NCI35688.1 hypothetical protein [Clostridium botulinum]NCI71821.1 hypothetical protein [Clostridium botulinum]NDI38737.1 hypothetical protein [Clostridium botulinum]
MQNNVVCSKTIKDAIIDYMNPYHIQYIKEFPFNSLHRLFESLNNLEEDKLNAIIEIASIYYIKNINGNLIKDKNKLLKQIERKCIEIAQNTSQFIAINAFVSVVANGLLHLGNPLSVNEKILEQKSFLENIKYNEKEIIERVKEKHKNSKEEIKKENVENIYNMLEQGLKNMKQSQKERLDLYNYFCNNVIKDLLEENYFETKKELEDKE